MSLQRLTGLPVSPNSVLLITHQAPLVQQGKLINNTMRFLGQPVQTQVPIFSQTNPMILCPGRAVFEVFILYTT